MKYFVVIFAILAVAVAEWTPKTKAQYEEDKKECFASEKISTSGQEAMLSGQFLQEPGCFYRCLGLKWGVWDDVDGFIVERSYAALQVDGWDVTLEGLRHCLTPDKKKDDLCKWALETVKCMFDNNLVRYNV